MQPYFFPYLGYFDLINRTDKWVVFDVVQYQKKSWMNRNRIHHPTDGWQYINAPVEKHGQSAQIKDIRIKNPIDIKNKLIAQLEHYKGKAQYYPVICHIIQSAFESLHDESLVELNVKMLSAVCDYMNVDFDYSICSQSSFNPPGIEHPGQWALEISSALNADEYINPPNGKSIFRVDEFKDRGIKLSFTSLVNLEYDCSPYESIEYLSIIDVLMFCSPQNIKQYLDKIK